MREAEELRERAAEAHRAGDLGRASRLYSEASALYSAEAVRLADRAAVGAMISMVLAVLAALCLVLSRVF